MKIGVCVFLDLVDNEDVKVWFNCVEEMVFIDDDFCRDIEFSIEVIFLISVFVSCCKF